VKESALNGANLSLEITTGALYVTPAALAVASLGTIAFSSYCVLPIETVLPLSPIILDPAGIFRCSASVQLFVSERAYFSEEARDICNSTLCSHFEK
jgi:hypothetical protein